MKRSFSLTLTFFSFFFFIHLVCVAVAAQANDHPVHIGFKAGASLPNLVGSSSQEITKDYKSRLAFNFGGFVDIGIKKKISLQLGLDYSPQGGKRNGMQPITSPLPGLPALPAGQYYFAKFNNTAKLNYLELPVMLKYRGRADKSVGYYFDGGLYFGYLLKATTITSGTSGVYLDKAGTIPILLPPNGTPLVVPFDATTKVTSSLHRFNFGFTGGGGMTFNQDNGGYFFLDGRVAYGLTTLQKNTATDGKSRTGNLVFSFGYSFKAR